MKKITTLLTILITAVLSFFCCAFTYANTENNIVSQQPNWVRITKTDTWLYKNASSAEEDKLFTLQYSYYAKVKEVTQNGYYYVEILDNLNGFVKILGYVPINEVTPQVETPVSPTYPSIFVTVKNNNVILFSQPNTSSQSVCAVYQGQILSYFGSYPTKDKTWHFVRFDQNLCYVDADSIILPAIALHPTPVIVQTVTPPAETPSEQEPQTEPTTNEFSKWQIAIISIIALSALVIVVVLFLPAKSKKQNTVLYDLNDIGTDDNVNTFDDKSLRPRYFDDYL